MKKIIIKSIAGIALVGSLTLVLTGCGKDKNSVKEYEKQENNQNTNIVSTQDNNSVANNITTNNTSASNTTTQKNNETNNNNEINKNIKLSVEERLKILTFSKNFERLDELKNEDMLETIAVALDNQTLKLDGSSTNSYKPADVKGAVYAVFGVEIKENISTEMLKYENGKYKIYHMADGDPVLSGVEITESDAAAGTAYYTYKTKYIDDDGNLFDVQTSYQVAISSVDNKVKSKKMVK